MELEAEVAACQGRNETPRETPERSGADSYTREVDDSALPDVGKTDVLGDLDIPYDFTVTVPRSDISSIGELSPEEKRAKSYRKARAGHPVRKGALRSQTILRIARRTLAKSKARAKSRRAPVPVESSSEEEEAASLGPSERLVVSRSRPVTPEATLEGTTGPLYSASRSAPPQLGQSARTEHRRVSVEADVDVRPSTSGTSRVPTPALILDDFQILGGMPQQECLRSLLLHSHLVINGRNHQGDLRISQLEQELSRCREVHRLEMANIAAAEVAA